MTRLWWAVVLVAAMAAPVYGQTNFYGQTTRTSTPPARSARPAEGMSGGIRAGASSDPDQFVFGGHIETKELADRLTFRPNVEIGVGNGATLVAVNIEFAYWLPTSTDPWKIYVGGGPAANILHISNFGTNTGGGFNFLIGAQHEGGLFTEFKLGVGDSPDVKFIVGYVFKRR